LTAPLAMWRSSVFGASPGGGATVVPSGNTLPLRFVYRTDVAFRTIAGRYFTTAPRGLVASARTFAWTEMIGGPAAPASAGSQADTPAATAITAARETARALIARTRRD